MAAGNVEAFEEARERNMKAKAAIQGVLHEPPPGTVLPLVTLPRIVEVLPTDAETRKNIPLARGLLDYFPNALAAVAEVSRVANEQHNPGQEMHWARGKSNDHADCVLRHLIDRGKVDSDGLRHTGKAAWRMLALLEEELEAVGAASGRASRFPDDE
jgi:hypothetical protein